MRPPLGWVADPVERSQGSNVSLPAASSADKVLKGPA
jgi:hypothetical protein